MAKRSKGARELSKAIAARSLTYEEAGHLLKVDARQIWRWVSGKTLPRRQKATRIEEVFMVSVYWWDQ